MPDRTVIEELERLADSQPVFSKVYVDRLQFRALIGCARAAGDWLTADDSEDSEAYAAARERARQALAALEGVGR